MPRHASLFQALTIWQPWASAIALRFKTIETRSWQTYYRGPLLIHAAKVWRRHEIAFHSEAVHQLRRVYGGGYPRLLEFEENPPLGAIIALARLADCVPTSSLAATAAERFFGDFSVGRFAWRLEEVVRIYPPIPCRGGQGLWTPPDHCRDTVVDCLAEHEEAIHAP